MGRRGNSAVTQVIDAVRQSRGAGLTVENIQSMVQHDLVSLQKSIGLGGEWGLIKIPISWLPPGGCQASSAQNLDFRRLLKTRLMKPHDVNLALTVMTRYFLLCFFSKAIGASSVTIFLAPTTILRACRSACKIALVALSIEQREGLGVFSRLQTEHVLNIFSNQKLRVEWNRMFAFNARGLWADMPSNAAILSQEVTSAAAFEAANAFQPPSVPFMPFPDEFVAAIGWRATWLVENFFETFLHCATQLIEVMETVSLGSISSHALESRKSRLATKILLGYKWKNLANGAISGIPFNVELIGNGNHARFEWPPRNLSQMRSLAGLLQASNLMVFL